MAGGRPTDYDESYCDGLIAHCKTGLSFESFAGEIGVSRDTLYEWRKKHIQFSDAANIAKECCRKYWEEKGRDGTIGDLEKFNSGSWQFIMKNFFREEWSDTVKQEITGKDGEKFGVQIYLPDNGRTTDNPSTAGETGEVS